MTGYEMLVVAAELAAHNMETALGKHPQGSAAFDEAVATHVTPLVLLQVSALAGLDSIDEIAALIEKHQSGTS